ncbi:ankyrin [Tothia fuscella]|uniref:Ankyrin n=1 Tax=Tothia fuscella TaxID=1048955 RepID=A0A9P4NN04_9PEZI|nr:ankyrin [Tothia fuscella]
MATIVKGGLLDTLGIRRLEKLGDVFKPNTSDCVRKLLQHKLRFGSKNDYFLTAIRESIAFYLANTSTGIAQSESSLENILLDAASIRRLQNEPWNLIKRCEPTKASIWKKHDSHSPSNHILAAMCYVGDEGLVRRYLVDHKVDLRINHAFGGPMQCAASQGHLHIVKLLMEAVEDVETLLPQRDMVNYARSHYVRYPPISGPLIEAAYAAAFGGHEVILCFLADLLYYSSSNHVGGSVCFRPELRRWAIIGGHQSVIETLFQPTSVIPWIRWKDLPKGVRNFNWRESSWDCGLFPHNLYILVRYGVVFGCEKAVRLALNHGYDIDQKYHYISAEPKQSALVWASAYGNNHIVEVLLEQGVGQQVEDMEDALVIASQRGFGVVVQLLIDHVLRNHTASACRLQEGSFLEAARSGHVHIIELLVELGMTAESVEQTRDSALSAALEKGFSGVTRVVEKLGS